MTGHRVAQAMAAARSGARRSRSFAKRQASQPVVRVELAADVGLRGAFVRISPVLFLEARTMETRDEDPAGVRTIKASEFKTKCLKLMDEVADNGVEIVITKNGRPVSRLIPYRKKPDTLFGIDRGKLEILGDIDEPLDVAWEAETGKVREDDH